MCGNKQLGLDIWELVSLNKPSNVSELKQMVDFEDFEEPYLLTGSPLCDPFSQL